MTNDGVALSFPGQGVQRQGMGKPWQDSPSWRVVADVSEWTGVDVEELLLRADAATLRRTDLAQLSVFTLSLVTLDALAGSPLLEHVVACAGHSLGEYAALVAAEVLSPREAALLVAARGSAMLDATQHRAGTMAALLGGTLDAAESLTAQVRAGGNGVWVANINAPDQVVVSGTVRGVERVTAMASERAIKAIDLAVAGAFHSPLMYGAWAGLIEALREATFTDARVPVVANVDARPHVSRHAWPSLALSQLTGAVQWEQSVRVLRDEFGCGRFVELGPGPNLLAMVRRIAPGGKRIVIDGPEAARQAAGASKVATRAMDGDPSAEIKQPPWSLLLSTVKLQDRDGHAAVAVVDVDASEPLFAGHFPGFPILPGVSLIECVHRGMKLAAHGSWPTSR